MSMTTVQKMALETLIMLCELNALIVLCTGTMPLASYNALGSDDSLSSYDPR